jgi:hypothetical protein
MREISIGGQICEVCRFPASESGVKYELLAPKGFRFFPDEIHCYPAYTAADVKSFAASVSLVACGPDCDCATDQ